MTSALVARLVEPLFEVVEHHVGEDLRRIASRDDRRNVVDLLRIGDRQERPGAGPHPDRLVVHAPVQRVAVARLHQQVRRHEALGDPGAEPALGRPCPPPRSAPPSLPRSAPAPPARSSCPDARNWCVRGPRSRRRARGGRPSARARDRTSRCWRGPWQAGPARRTSRADAMRRPGCRTRAKRSSARRAAMPPGPSCAPRPSPKAKCSRLMPEIDREPLAPRAR